MFKYLMMSLVVVLSLSCSQQQQATSERNKIEVYGAGDVISVPDRFSFSLSIEKKGQQASELNQRIVEQTSAIVTALKNVGVDNKAIQSMQVQFTPWVEYSGQRRQQKGFILTRRVTVTLDDLTQYENAIDAVLNIGVNTINQFSASNSQAQALYEQALAVAINNAKQKAADMAENLGLKLAGVISISEKSAGQVAPTPMRSRLMASDESYQPGKMATQASVRIVFALQENS